MLFVIALGELSQRVRVCAPFGMCTELNATLLQPRKCKLALTRLKIRSIRSVLSTYIIHYLSRSFFIRYNIEKYEIDK